MTYGRIDIPVPTLEKEYAAIDDQLSKELITPAKAKRLKTQLDKDRLLFIAHTNNGGYNYGKRYRRRLYKNMMEAVAANKAQTTREIRDDLLNQAEETDEKAPVEKKKRTTRKKSESTTKETKPKAKVRGKAINVVTVDDDANYSESKETNTNGK